MPAMRATGCLCSIAGKPAPTWEWQLFRSQHTCRSLACQRCGGPGVCVQSLASQLPQGEWQCTPLFSTQLPQGSGNFSDHNKSVGAWLASDEGDWVSLFNRWQASSHRGSGSAHHCSAHSSHSGSGNFSDDSKSVGAWLASDAGDWVSLFNPWQASSHKTQCSQGIFGRLSDQKLAGVLALMISASSAPIFLKRWGSVVGK